MTATREELLSLIGRLEEATEEQVRDQEWLKETRATIADAFFDRAKPDAFSEPRWWFSGWFGWETLEDGPNWLFSIDAAIPGESIRKVERRRFDNGTVYWVAVQDADGDGCGFEGHGATEALARRIACLKARAKLMESTP